MTQEERGRYMASRKWMLKREYVRRRSGGQCERCWGAPMYAVHHLTYARMGDERGVDLQGLCNPCHEFVSGKSDTDPALKLAAELRDMGVVSGDDVLTRVLRAAICQDWNPEQVRFACEVVIGVEMGDEQHIEAWNGLENCIRYYINRRPD